VSLEQRYIDWVPRGESALGEWFDVRHASIGRSMAVCRLHPHTNDPARAARLRSVAALRHPNIVAIVDADLDGDSPFIVIDGAARHSLQSALDEGPVPPERALRWIRGMLRAVRFAHLHGVHHGALAPSRVLLDAAGSVQLGEFGVTAAAADPRGHTVAIDSDAMAYLPLHVLRNPNAYDQATDCHAAAAIAFHLLLGDVVEGQAPASIPGVSEPIVDTLADLMQRDADVDTLERALRALAHVPESFDDVAGPALDDAPYSESSAATIFEASPIELDAAPAAFDAAPVARPAGAPASGTMVMSAPVRHRFETGGQVVAPEATDADAIRASLRQLEGLPANGGATVVESPFDSPEHRAEARDASGMVLDALGGEVEDNGRDDGEHTPFAHQDDATNELNAAIHAAAAVAREARQRAQEALRRHAHLFRS
jgi:hypothetical protein